MRKPESAGGIARLILIAGLLVVMLSGCKSDQISTIQIDLSRAGHTESSDQEPMLRVAVSAMTGPQETSRQYLALLRYLGKSAGLAVKPVQRQTYQEVNDLLLMGEIDLAFVCTGAYLGIAGSPRIELLAAPVVNGATTYQSYIVARKGTIYHTPSDLQGTRFAYTDSLSLTGRKFPDWLIQQVGGVPKDFFATSYFTGGHDRSLLAVRQGMVDFAAVDGLIYDFYKLRRPEFLGDVVVVDRSQPFGIPPVVIRADLPTNQKDLLRHALLNCAGTTEGRTILDALRIERFATVDDTIYDSAMELIANLETDHGSD